MERKAAITPSIIPAFLALLVLILFGYLIFSDLKSSRTEHTITPAINVVDLQSPLPLTVIEGKEDSLSSEQAIAQEAEQFVNNLSPDSDQPLIINEYNDLFARQDSLLSLPDIDSLSLAIEDIVPSQDHAEDALYYIHRVTKEDQQGLWGIIQTGLIDKFRQGLPLKGISQNKELASAVIPADADEKLLSGLSSFLGKILNDKVNDSYVYNFESHVMGQNADTIYPGQQLVVIKFSAAELTDIYQFFSKKRNQGVETFAIED
ncbi:MAG: hypothetical protein COA90_09425 [Gammaproteobacteria bacterium]|nr:MAG: hypothetical protein COA90_09425 [Gammaproteobacteria bacterium]